MRLLDSFVTDRTGSQIGLMSGWAVQVNDWMEGMLMDCYEDLYRFKGVLAIQGWPDRFIFQASQPMFGCDLDVPMLPTLDASTSHNSSHRAGLSWGDIRAHFIRFTVQGSSDGHQSDFKLVQLSSL